MMAAAESPAKSMLRTVARSTGLLGAYYRALEVRIAMSYPKAPGLAPDGKPLPSRLAIMRICGGADWKWFYESGRHDAEDIIRFAKEAGEDPVKWASVLDWGCGCGRIARHISSFTPAKLIGRDIDRLTVRWSAQHLDGDFRASRLQPPLDLQAATIDFVYGFSVLTHLTGPTQERWLREVGRVLKPGALAVLTFHDQDHPGKQVAPMRREDGGIAVTEWALEGSNLVATFQDYASICRAAEPWFEPVRKVGGDETHSRHAVAVLRRRQPN